MLKASISSETLFFIKNYNDYCILLLAYLISHWFVMRGKLEYTDCKSFYSVLYMWLSALLRVALSI